MNTWIALDGLTRCTWTGGAPEFLAYHDDEWGQPSADDQRLFEKLSLEGFQSGLSWRTILNKRDAFRESFAGFNIESVARFGKHDVERMLGNAGIVRHRGKIEAVIDNAQRAVDLIDAEGSLAAYVWRFEPDAAELGAPQTLTMSPSSIAMSKDLKKRGWRFVGPTTMFAFMQSMGLVNDHVEACVIRDRVDAARAAFARP